MTRVFILAENNPERDNLSSWLPAELKSVHVCTQARYAEMECEHSIRQKEPSILIISDKPSLWMTMHEKTDVQSVIRKLAFLRTSADNPKSIAFVLVCSTEPSSEIARLLAGQIMRPIKQESYISLLTKLALEVNQ